MPPGVTNRALYLATIRSAEGEARYGISYDALSGPVGEAVMVGDTGWLLNERHGAPELRKDATDAGTIEGQRHVAWGSVGVVLAIRIGTRF